jgi:hypothetical protein
VSAENRPPASARELTRINQRRHEIVTGRRYPDLEEHDMPFDLERDVETEDDYIHALDASSSDDERRQRLRELSASAWVTLDSMLDDAPDEK